MGKEGKGVKSQVCHISGTCEEDKLPKETDNNNLLWAARVLELIYNTNELTVPKFFGPSAAKYKNIRGKKIQGSLRENGKSRADLWALAGMTAVELGTQFHNTLCDENDMTRFCGGNPDNSACGVDLPVPEFKYGRKDCVQKCQGHDAFYGFCSPAAETHPDPHGNGKHVTDFFKDEFQLTAKESIALMGAHTLGHANEQVGTNARLFSLLFMVKKALVCMQDQFITSHWRRQYYLCSGDSLVSLWS